MSVADTLYLRYVGLHRRGFGDIVDAVCREHLVTRDELLGTSRFAHIVAARKALWFHMRQAGLSYPAIGRLVGRDHTTVMVALRPFVGRQGTRLEEL